DRITGAVADPAGDQSVGERLVAVHRDLRATASSRDMLETVVLRQNVADRVRVAGLESHQRRVHHALVFAAEFFRDQSFQLIGIEIENLRDQPEYENVFAFVLRGAAQRLDGQTGDGHADVNATFVVKV